MIYLAQPYSALDPYTRELRYRLAVKAIAEFAQGGIHIFSPIVHWHVAARSNALPTDANFWWASNRSHLDACKCLYLLRLPGWEGSKGMKQEVVHALSQGYPIHDAVVFPESIEAYRTFKATRLIFKVLPSNIHPGDFLTAGDDNGKDNQKRGAGRSAVGGPLGR